jgi:hypothetical protein
MSITAMSPVVLANNGASFLQSVPSTPGGNWLQNSATATSTSDWMDPSAGAAQDAVSAAANAMAAAEQVELTNKNSLAVNTGMSVLSSQLTGSVNILA